MDALTKLDDQPGATDSLGHDLAASGRLAERPDVVRLRACFDATDPLTIGLEEEVLLLELGTHRPAPVAEAIVEAAGHPAIKQELPTCQVELVTRPHRDVGAAVSELGDARIALSKVCRGAVEPAAAAVHPFALAATVGSSPLFKEIECDFGEIARRQLVGSLQVHVALGSAEASLAVYNALRGHLPELAALAASAPFHEGRDVGLASVRPLICGQLPRQGVPPALPSWEHFADQLAWGEVSGTLPGQGRWWWELRPHVTYGTLEVRVADVQASIAATHAVAQTVRALAAHLLDRHLNGEVLPVPETWRIAENRWRALRDGVHGELLDLETGAASSTDRCLNRLLDAIEPHVDRGDLDGARRLVARNGADDLRTAGLTAATHWLADQFC